MWLASSNRFRVNRVRSVDVLRYSTRRLTRAQKTVQTCLQKSEQVLQCAALIFPVAAAMWPASSSNRFRVNRVRSVDVLRYSTRRLTRRGKNGPNMPPKVRASVAVCSTYFSRGRRNVAGVEQQSVSSESRPFSRCIEVQHATPHKTRKKRSKHASKSQSKCCSVQHLFFPWPPQCGRRRAAIGFE